MTFKKKLKTKKFNGNIYENSKERIESEKINIIRKKRLRKNLDQIKWYSKQIDQLTKEIESLQKIINQISHLTGNETIPGPIDSPTASLINKLKIIKQRYEITSTTTISIATTIPISSTGQVLPLSSNDKKEL